MKDIFMSPIGFWSAFTIVFIFVVMGWFFMKMVKLSKKDSNSLEKEDES